LPDGRYGVGISVGDDVAWVLSREQAVAYVVVCVERATQADHDTATFRLLVDIGLPEDKAAAFLAEDIRQDRAVDNAPTSPLVFVPAVGQKGPFLHMRLDTEDVGQLTPADLRDHALSVLDVLAVVELDAALRRALVGLVGLDDARAHAVVGGLAKFWPKSRPPRTYLDTSP
jgi:hypothetical protein